MSELTQIHNTLLSLSTQMGAVAADVATIKSRGTALEGKVEALQLTQAQASGRSSVLGTIAGAIAGIVTAIAAVLVKQLFGAPAA